MQNHKNGGVERLSRLLKEADGVLVGVGSGLSSAAGYNHYHWGSLLEPPLHAFRRHYNFASPFAGFYYCYSRPEQQWAYYARSIHAMQTAPVGKPYLDLMRVLEGKDYFVLTTNVDTQCERAIPAHRLCLYQGSVNYLQCMQPCSDEVFAAPSTIAALDRSITELEVTEAIPRCPHCGWKMVPWVRDDTFLEGSFWREGVDRYEAFVRRHITAGSRLLLLELGVGEMTPAVIKLPFWDLAARHKNVTYARINRDGAAAPVHLGERALSLCMDLSDALGLLAERT